MDIKCATSKAYKTGDSSGDGFIARVKKVNFSSICNDVDVGFLDGRRMEIYGINILYIMTMPMGNIVAITLMNSQQTVPRVNTTA